MFLAEFRIREMLKFTFLYRVEIILVCKYKRKIKSVFSRMQGFSSTRGSVNESMNLELFKSKAEIVISAFFVWGGVNGGV